MAGEDDIVAAIDAAEEAGAPEDRAATPLDRTCAQLLRNDIGNAERLIARFGQDLHFVSGLGWVAWVGTHWEAEAGDDVARAKAQLTARALFPEAKTFPPPDTDAIWRGVLDDGGEEKEAKAAVAKAKQRHADTVTAHLKFARSSGNSGKISAMLTEAAPHLARRQSEFDADPFVFNAANRTLVLPRGGGALRARPHARGDRITKLAGAAFEPGARAPRFEAFLAAVQPEAVMRAYLQRVAGYLLTGSMAEQAFFIFWGSGRNGKGTFMNALKAVLGSYAVTAKVETFGDRRMSGGSEASPDVARMLAARMVGTTDAPDHFTIDAGLIKQATGEEPMLARKLHKEFFEFLMTGKVVIPCNPQPRIPGTDEGIWRRVHLVPWRVTIPAADVDTELGAALKAEASGILNWMIEGFLAWRERGLDPPDGVRAATAAYRHESDPFGEFLTLWTDRTSDPVVRTQSAKLFEAFKLHCKLNGLPEPKSNVAFGKEMKKRGFVSVFANGGLKFWTGIQLRETARDSEDAAGGADASGPRTPAPMPEGGRVEGVSGDPHFEASSPPRGWTDPDDPLNDFD